MKKKLYRVIGVVLIISGISVLVFGLLIFRYRPTQLHSIVSDFGVLSFIIWLSIVVAGIMFLRAGRKHSRILQ